MNRLAKLLLSMAMAAAIAAPLQARERDVILTTDCGAEIDDQFAIAYLALLPQIHVLAMVTTHAPNLPKQAQSSAQCAKDVLAHLDAGPPPPIFAGSDVPLARRTPLENAGVDFIVEASQRHSAKNRLVIITIGATTDVASAFLLDPQLGERVEILTMGFDSWPKGGDPWNIKNDPLAYQVILDSAAPITIGASDVCQRHLRLDDKTAAQMLVGHGEFAQWLEGQFQHWLEANAALAARVVGPHTWVIWDTVTVAHLQGFTTAQIRPRPALEPADLTFSFPPTKKTVYWITSINAPAMWADFIGRIDRADSRRPKN
jgi:purine nucleosidase